MSLIIISIFVIGYLFITLEHYTKLNKTAIALLTGMLCWAVYALMNHDVAHTQEAISHHIIGIAEILFFLLGAMTIVELIDAHKGFSIITDRINTKNARTLLWIVGGIAFLLAAVIDILAAAIVVVTMLRKLVKDEKQRKLLAGFTVVAANAGGAWSPIGAVTTTMLWIGGQVSASGVVQSLLLPSLVCLAMGTLAFYPKMKGKIELLPNSEAGEKSDGKIIMFV
ncbi:MAG: sodium:proton antiporter NhaD, partial [Bacteroidia bacterium]